MPFCKNRFTLSRFSFVGLFVLVPSIVSVELSAQDTKDIQNPQVQKGSENSDQAEPQKSDAQPKQKKRKIPPVFQSIEDVAGLPRVLLIGDSISIGYTLQVRQGLKGKANVHRPPTNCGPTTKGLKGIEKWLGDKEWAVIHFNWGLHDLKYMGPNNENLADPDDEKNHQQVPPAEYEKNLSLLVDRLKKTNAKLLWRNTTPVPERAKGRVAGDSIKYNAIAAKVMEQRDVAIHDAFGLVQPRMGELMLPNGDVHFKKSGSQVLADDTIKTILDAIKPESNEETTPESK